MDYIHDGINKVPLSSEELNHGHVTYKYVIENIKAVNQNCIVFNTDSMWVHALILPQNRFYYGICIYYDNHYDGILYNKLGQCLGYVYQSQSQQRVFDQLIMRLIERA